MKTIEERGGDFATNYEVLDDNGRQKNEYEIACESYISGAKDEHELLTRWHDPKEELPEYIKVVEVKYKAFNKIMMAIAFRLGDLWSGKNKWCIDGTSVRIDHENILGWREIQE